MDLIYCLINGNEWEDMIIFLSVEEVIKESINNPNYIIEIFSKNNNKPGYSPTYDYYKNGRYVRNP